MENIVDVSCSWPLMALVSGQKLKNLVLCDVVSSPKFVNFTLPIPELIAKRSSSVPTNINGWFLVQSSSEQLCLWNPVTLKSINLPSLESPIKHWIDYVFLTKSPSDPNCIVLLIQPCLVHYCYANGDNDWTNMDYQEELKEFRGGSDYIHDTFKTPVSIDDDKMIMVSFSGVVTKIEVVGAKKIAIKPYPNLSKPKLHFIVPCVYTLDYWVACYGDLYVIYVACGGHAKEITSIDVFKLNFSEMLWEKVNSCPNIAFFVRECYIRGQQGKELGFACPITSADSSKVGNRVYFVEYEDEGKENEETRILLHTYHIQQKTLKTSLVATSNDEVEPYWILVSSDQARVKAKHDYRSGEDIEKIHLFAQGEKTMEMMIVHNDNEDDEKKYSTSLENLPIDILKIITSRLTCILDYLNFRAISRYFRDNFSKNEWRCLRASKSDTNQYPWLISPKSQRDGKFLFSMMDLISGNKHNVRTPETLEENSRICYSANGWLLMVSPKGDMVEEFNLFFYNPITKSTIRLPELFNFDASYFSFIGSPEYAESCTVLGVSRYIKYKENEWPSYYTISKESGEDEWEELWSDEELMVEHNEVIFNVEQSNVNVVNIYDVFYFLVSNGNLAYISCEDSALRIHSLEEPCEKSSYKQCFLAACDEILYSIYIGKGWKWLRAFKFNESDMIWDEVKELKGKNLYLSYVSSTFLEPQLPDVGNKIYFSKFCQDSIVYYSFKTNQFHLKDGKDSVISDYYGSEEQMYSCWIEPNWKLKTSTLN